MTFEELIESHKK